MQVCRAMWNNEFKIQSFDRWSFAVASLELQCKHPPDKKAKRKRRRNPLPRWNQNDLFWSCSRPWRTWRPSKAPPGPASDPPPCVSGEREEWQGKKTPRLESFQALKAPALGVSSGEEAFTRTRPKRQLAEPADSTWEESEEADKGGEWAQTAPKRESRGGGDACVGAGESLEPADTSTRPWRWPAVWKLTLRWILLRGVDSWLYGVGWVDIGRRFDKLRWSN